MASPLDKLNILKANLPQANAQAAEQANQARQLQLQQTIQQAPSNLNVGQQQALGAKSTSMLGQGQLAANQQTQQAQQQLGQLALGQQAMTGQTERVKQKLLLNEKQNDIMNRLQREGIQLDNKMIKKQYDFAKNQANQTIFNQRQLMDYAVQNAKDENDLRKFIQDQQQMADKYILMLDVAKKKIEQQLAFAQQDKEAQLDREQKIRLTEQKNALEKAIQKKANQAKNSASAVTALFTVGGTAAGAALGTLTGTPMGAALGAQAGAGVGAGVGQLFAGTDAGQSTGNLLTKI